MEEKTKILLCEDDENLGTLLCEYLIAKVTTLCSALMAKLVSASFRKTNTTSASST